MRLSRRFDLWFSPLRDPALGACALLAGALLFLPQVPFRAWAVGVLHLALLAIVVTVLERRRRVAPRSSEVGFWRDLIWAVAIWMFADVVLAAGQAGAWPELAVATRCLGGGAWLAVWLATTQTPHRRGYWRPRKVERRLHSAGAAVVALGSMAYVVAPQAWIRGVDSAFQVTWLLLAFFALLVTARLIVLVFDAGNDRWRGVYGALAAAAAVAGWSHVDALMGPEPAASAVLGGPWAAVSLTLLVVCARLDQIYGDDETAQALGDPIEEGPRYLEAPYLALAVAIPLFHHAFARAGFFDSALEPVRERIMLVWALALLTVSIYQQRRLERWARRTLSERSRLERSLQASRRRVQLMEEKQQAEDVIHRTKQVYSKAFQGSPWAVVLTRRDDGRHLECNERYLEVIGYTRDQVIGRSSLELGIWPYPEQRQAMIEELSRGGSLRGFEFTFRRRDGEERPALISAEATEIDGEQCLLSVARDLTEFRHESQRRQALMGLLETLPSAVWRLDLNDRVKAVNPAAERVAGPAAEQRGRLLTDQSGLAEVDSWRQATRTVIERGRFEGELAILKKGRPHRARAFITLTRDPYGLPSGKMLFLRPAE